MSSRRLARGTTRSEGSRLLSCVKDRSISCRDGDIADILGQLKNGVYPFVDTGVSLFESGVVH